MAMDLGEVLRTLRRGADLSQRELAERCGVPKSTVTRLEAGTITNPAFRTVERLVEAAGGSMMIDATEPHEPKPLLAELAQHGAQHREQRHQHATPHESLRDRAGRRYPAHLDPRATYPMFGQDGMPLRAGTRVISFELDRDMRDDRRAREAPTDAVRIEQREVSEDVAWEWIAVADDQTVGWLGAHVWPDVVRRDRSGTGRRVVLCRMEIHGAWSGTGLNRRLVDALRKWRDERGDIDAYSVGLAHRDLTMLKEAGFYPASGYVPRMLTLSAE